MSVGDLINQITGMSDTIGSLRFLHKLSLSTSVVRIGAGLGSSPDRDNTTQHLRDAEFSSLSTRNSVGYV
jgi:hypothetical protein